MISADEARSKLEIKATHYLDRLEATVDAEVTRAIELDVCEFTLSYSAIGISRNQRTT